MSIDNIIVGLGNPGNDYQGSRHNIGFDIVSILAKQFRSIWRLNKKFQIVYCKINYKEKNILLIKPQVYMNESGSCINKICKFYKISISNQLFVIQDDINLELGRLKISKSGSSGGHNGVQNIISYLGKKFIRIRIGIGKKFCQNITLSSYVLSSFQENEKKY